MTLVDNVIPPILTAYQSHCFTLMAFNILSRATDSVDKTQSFRILLWRKLIGAHHLAVVWRKKTLQSGLRRLSYPLEF